MRGKMHPKTNTHKRHRSVVALPVAMLLLALSVRDGWMHQRLPADVATSSILSVAAADAARTVPLPQAALRVELGTTIDLADVSDPFLRSGTVMMSGKGTTAVHAGDAMLEGWNGSYQVTVEGNSLTVAALTTP